MPARSDLLAEDSLVDPGALYVRGAVAPAIDGRRIGRILVAILSLVLGVVLVATAVQTHRSDARRRELDQRGVPASLVVAGCTGLASGTGITVSSYTCHGAVMFRGRVYDDVLTGLARPWPKDHRVPVLLDPAAPTRVSTLPAATAAARDG